MDCAEYGVKALFTIIFALLFCSVFLWFFLCYRLFNSLETRHPEKYQAMGRPKLFTNNTFSNNFAFIKFLFKREWRELNDSGLTNLGNAMLAFIVIYLLGFLSLCISLPLVYTT